jgi:methionyl-tRNA formyltransferase
MPSAAAGEILVEAGNVYVACGSATTLQLSHVKLEGRKQITVHEFANGARLQPGERFGKA